MPIEYAILGIPAEGDLHGYELTISFNDKAGEELRSLNYGRIYSMLARLEKEELVTHNRQAQDKRPDRKIFSIIPQVGNELEKWPSTPVAKVRALRDGFIIPHSSFITQKRDKA